MKALAQRAPSPTPLRGAGPYVLLAEDDLEMRTLLTADLSRRGYNVTALADGGQLLDYLRDAIAEGIEEPPDVLVSDIRMPCWSGMEALDFVRSKRWGIPIILITAFGDEDAHRRAAEHCAVLLDKPFDLDSLADALSSLLAT